MSFLKPLNSRIFHPYFKRVIYLGYTYSHSVDGHGRQQLGPNSEEQNLPPMTIIKLDPLHIIKASFVHTTT